MLGSRASDERVDGVRSDVEPMMSATVTLVNARRQALLLDFGDMVCPAAWRPRQRPCRRASTAVDSGSMAVEDLLDGHTND